MPLVAPPTLEVPIFSPEAWEQAKKLNLCPHWQRLTFRGACVDDWWVGAPVSWFSAAIATTVAMAALGWVIVLASKVRPLQGMATRARKVVKVPSWVDEG